MSRSQEEATGMSSEAQGSPMATLEAATVIIVLISLLFLPTLARFWEPAREVLQFIKP